MRMIARGRWQQNNPRGWQPQFQRVDDRFYFVDPIGKEMTRSVTVVLRTSCAAVHTNHLPNFWILSRKRLQSSHRMSSRCGDDI